MKHVLITGKFRVQLQMNEETGEMAFEWTPDRPKTKAQLRRVQKDYIHWRNEIVAQWTLRSGKKTMLCEYDNDGNLIGTEFENGKVVSLGKAIYHNPDATGLGF